MVAVADLMLCIAAQAMMIYEDEYAAQQQKFADREAAIQQAEAEMERKRARTEKVIEKREQEAEQDLTKVRAAVSLERERRGTCRRSSGDHRFPLRKQAQEAGPGRQARVRSSLLHARRPAHRPHRAVLTDDQVRAWLAELPETTKEIALYVENGEREYHHGRSGAGFQRINCYTFALLPPTSNPATTRRSDEPVAQCPFRSLRRPARFR